MWDVEHIDRGYPRFVENLRGPRARTSPGCSTEPRALSGVSDVPPSGIRLVSQRRGPSPGVRAAVTSAAESADTSPPSRSPRAEPVKIGARIGIAGLRRHPPADRLAGAAGRVRAGRRAGRPERRVPGAGRGSPSGRCCCGCWSSASSRVALWRLEQAIWGYSYVSDHTKNAPQAGGQRGQGRGLPGARRARRPDGGGRWRAAAVGSRAPLPACSGCRVVSSSSARSASGSSSPAASKIYEGWQKKFRRATWTCRRTDRPARSRVRTGQVGFIAKGIAIGLIGILVVVAAVRFRPEEASGLDAALKAPRRPAVRAVPADRGGARAGRLRRVLLLRRPLPPGVGSRAGRAP